MPTTKLVLVVRPDFQEPRHLAPLTADWDRICAGEQVEVVQHAPVRHGKSKTLFVAIARYLLLHPERRVAYLTYNQPRAESRSIEIKDTFRALGGEIGQIERAFEWWTTRGGGLVAGGPGSGITGMGFDWIVCDDVIKDRAEADSKATMDGRWRWLADTVLSRREPSASVTILGARWARDDIAGRAMKDFGFRYVRLPALCDDEATDPLGRKLGEPLWPERWPLEMLEQIKAQNPRLWASNYQGLPLVEGEALFEGEPARYVDVPADGWRVAGIDCAYVGREAGSKNVLLRGIAQGRGDGLRIWLTDMVATREPFVNWVQRLRGMRWLTGETVYWLAHSVELGGATALREAGVPVRTLRCTADKYANAQEAARAWAEGRILLPAEAGGWSAELINELRSFRANSALGADYVDALSGMVHGASRRGGPDIG